MGVPSLAASNGTYTTTAGATTLTPPLPATRTNNNVLISYISVKATGQTFTKGGTDAANWTVGATLNTGNQSIAWAWRLVTGTEVALQWSWGSSVAGAGQVVQFTGNTTPTPVGANNTASANTSTTATAAGITSTADNSLMYYNITASTSQTIPGPPNYTNLGTAANANTSAINIDGAVNQSGRTSDAISVAVTTCNWASFGIEILGTGTGTSNIRTTQNVLQVAELYNTTNFRTTQIVLQVLIGDIPVVPPPHGHNPPPPPPKSGQIRHTGYKLQRWRRENQSNITGLQQFLAWNPVPTFERITEDKWHQPWSIPRTLQLRGIHANKTQALIPGQEIAPIIPPIPPGTNEILAFPPWSIPRRLPRKRGVNPIRAGEQQAFINPTPKEIFIQGTWFSIEVNADIASFSIGNTIEIPPAYDVSVSIKEIPAIRRASAGVREDPLY